jgi:hypothetical protein
MKRIVPSPAMAVAFVALLVAFTGSSFAAPARDAASKLVSGTKIAKSSITSKQIKNGSLLAADFKKGQLPRGATGPAGARGAQGPQGAQGAQGPQGPQGPGAPVAWAQVAESGTLVRGSGAVSAVKENGGNSAGQYEVVFNRNISNCTYIASHISDLTSPVPGGISATGPLSAQDNQNAVSIGTRNGGGTLTFAPFAIAVYC